MLTEHSLGSKVIFKEYLGNAKKMEIELFFFIKKKKSPLLTFKTIGHC